jgi:hypothetical protein
MTLVEPTIRFAPPPEATLEPASSAAPELAARRSLRAQIARLEQRLSSTLVTAFEAGLDPTLEPAADPTVSARLLDLGELEQLRDELVRRLDRARAGFPEHAAAESERRVLLERILERPDQYSFTRLQLRGPGERNCGVYQVRPRHGLIGMLRGWWQVKLSSGCPLPGGRGVTLRPVAAHLPVDRP